VTEKEVLDLPTGVVSFYMDTVDPRTPGIVCHLFLKKIHCCMYLDRVIGSVH